MSDVVQKKLVKQFDRTLDKAIAYYTVFSALYELKLRRREIELLAFTAVRGTITPLSARQDFIRIFGSSAATIENTKARLLKKNLLFKEREMYRVAPTMVVDFSRTICMQINLHI